MDKETIFKFYWDLFLSHVCEFYPLEREFIEYYEYELDWRSISKNRVIIWNEEFIEKYQVKFAWHELSQNDSIGWGIEQIDKFKKKLDWRYLASNKSLIVTEELIKKFSKKLLVRENNPSWTPELKERYKDNVMPSYKPEKVKEISLDNLEKFFKKYNDYDINHSKLFEKIFLPIILASSLEEIFKNKFDYNQRYYYLEPIGVDYIGITPEFEPEGENPFFTEFHKLKKGRGLFEIKEELILTNGSPQEGANRLYEVPQFLYSSYATILVSENIKKVLDQFKLSKHIYHSVQIKPKKITTTTKFFILHLEIDTLTKDLDYASQSYYFSHIGYNSRNHSEIESKILTYSEVETLRDKIWDEVGSLTYLYPNQYKIDSDFDVYTYFNGKFIVNQYVKDALEQKFPGQMSFKSAQLLNIKINQKAYDAKKDRVIDFKNISKVHYSSSAESLHYYAKKERLEKKDVAFKSELGQKDEFSDKEKELNVFFSDTIKKKILGKKINIKGYDLLPINEFYTQNDYSETYPESYKSVIIAQNEYGDSIGLMLEKESDHNLQNNLFYFLHEEGEVKKV